MIIKSERRLLFFCILCVWLSLTGCGVSTSEDIASEYSEADGTAAAGEEQEQPQAQVASVNKEEEQYRQFALYIWQGLREYHIEGSFTAWFQKPKEEGVQVVVLEKGQETWLERLSFEVNEDGWLTILPSYEPVMCGEPGNQDSLFYYQDEEEISQVMSRPDYHMVIDQSEPLSIVTRFDRPQGMRSRDEMVTSWSFGQWPNINSHEYLLWDERKDANIRILYPEVYFNAEEAGKGEKINRIIKDSFFYGYYGEGNEETWEPEKEMWITIDRSYLITKNTEDCISMRIYESNDYRRAAHPNEWETGLTLDLQTGEKISLQTFLTSILGREITLEQLLSTGVFKTQWLWSDSGDGEQTEDDLSEEWIRKIREEYKGYGYTLEDMENSFYLTETGLGLITFQGRYYTNIEAELDELKNALKITD